MTSVLEPPRTDPGAEAPAPTADPTVPDGPTPGSTARTIGAEPAWVLGALLLGAGAIHVAMAPSHLGSSGADGAAFLAAGWVQILLAVAVVRRPRPRVLLLAGAASAVALGAWVVSRTVGLPYGSHSGESEPVAFVDGVTAGLEVAAVLLVVGSLLLASVPPRPNSGNGRAGRRGAALVAALGVLALATAAMASPSAREHGGTGHGHGGETAAHGHGAPAGEDDLGYADLVNGQMGSHHHEEGAEAAPSTVAADEVGPLADELAGTAELVESYPTLADAEAAGYTQAGPFSPGLGIHYMPPGMTMNQDGDMDPEDVAGGMLIYDGIEPDARLAGFMYMAYQETAPEGFTGDLDTWHFHTAVCMVVAPDGTIETPFGADLTGVTEEMCEAEGGTLMDFSGYMVHVWTVPGYESPEGTFSDLNPKITCPDGTYHRIPIAEIGDADTTCRV